MPTNIIRTHPAPDRERYQMAGVKRATGREVHRNARHAGPQPAEDATHAWLEAELIGRPRQDADVTSGEP
jgi:hypothetical protein